MKMTNVIKVLYLTTALELALMAWGKLQNSSVLPDVSPSPTFTPDCVSFGQANYMTSEDEGFLEIVIEVEFGKMAFTDIFMQVEDMRNTAERGSDYDPGPFNVMIKKGEKNGTFYVDITKDAVCENDEDFSLVIVADSLKPDSICLGRTIKTKVTIVDDKCCVSFGQANYMTSEDEGFLEIVIEVEFGKMAFTDIFMQVEDMRNTAESGSDYGPGPFNVTIKKGEKNGTFYVDTTKDAVCENDEDFSLVIVADSLKPDSICLGRTIKTKVTIVDDKCCVSFSQANYMTSEDEGFLEIVIEVEFGKMAFTDIFMQVEDMRNTAESGSDYEPGPFNVTIKKGEKNGTFYVDTIKDAVCENDEDFSLVIVADSLKPDSICLGRTIKTKVTIVDDKYCVSFGQANYMTSEEGFLEIVIEVEFGKMAFTDIFMQVEDMRNTAERGSDYGPGPFNVTIKKGEKNGTFYVDITKDAVYENDEDFSLVIVADSLQPDSICLGRTITAKVTIVDDEYTLTFGETIYVFDEDDNNAKLSLSVGRPLRENITVNFAYIDLTTTGNHSTNDKKEIDYYTSNGVIFPTHTTTINLTLNIVNDNRLERNELFRIVAKPPEMPKNRRPAEADIIIRDDDAFEITFEMDQYVFDKNQVDPIVKLLLRYPEGYVGFVTFPINVTIDKVNAMAIGKNADTENLEVFKSYNLSFKENETEKTLIIHSINDSIVEPNETFILIINEDTITTGLGINDRVVVGKYGRAEISIVNDNDCVSFGQANYTVYEDEGLLEIVIEVESGKMAFTDIFLQIEDMRNTAENGTDYDSGPFNVTIKRGERNATFHVDVINDALYENDEDFSLVIVADSLKPDSICLGHTVTTKVTIVDDEYTLTFGETLYVFDEAVNSAKLSLSVSRPLRENITVNFTYIDFTTIGNHSTNDKKEIDYYTNNGVIFPAHSATINLTLNIVNDRRLERNELFRIVAVPPEVPKNRRPAIADIIIRDDDDFKITFEMDNYVIDKSQADPMVKLLLRYPEVHSIVFPINVTVDKVNAMANGKNAGSYSLSFKENETEKTLIIHSIDDKIVGPNETFFLIIEANTITTGFSPGRPNSRIIVGEYGRAMITIVNDDAEGNCSITMINGSFMHSRNRKSTFRFSSDGDPKASYKCKLDDKKFDDCKSPMVWKNLRRGKHTVTVKASCTDDKGERLATEKRKFKFKIR